MLDNALSGDDAADSELAWRESLIFLLGGAGHAAGDEDIPSIETTDAPIGTQIQGLVTRARAKQLNYQVLLFL
jgi:hypothetical protein